MDKSQELMSRILGRQKFMNAVIHEANSPIQQFYSGATIFITGGTGFLGKQFIEKLLRACKINKIYILMRSKKGKSIQERLDYMLKDPVYDTLRGKQSDFAKCLEAIDGDVAELSLGLSDANYTRITEEVDFIFHMAASTNFNVPLRDATLINVRGTRECVALAKACKKLRCFTHVSTAYTHVTESRIETEIKEQFYPSPMLPEEIIKIVENGDMCVDAVKQWPNTYTFSKAIAEELIRTNIGELPICVVRPPVVLPTYCEPAPGWLDLGALYGPSGLVLGIVLGVIHVLPIEVHKYLNIVPLDYVNNCIIAATWDYCERKKNIPSKGDPIYTISSSKRGLVWGYLGSIFRNNETRGLVSPLAVWYGYLYETTNPYLFWLMTWICHYIPAYIVDGICKVFNIKIKGIPSLRKMYKKIYDMSNLFSVFMNHNWYFNDDNLTEMICRMSGKDRAIFNCDIYTIDYGQYMQIFTIGLRKYIIKDGLVGAQKGIRNQKLFYVANLIYLFLVVYFVYFILYCCYFGIKNIILYVVIVYFHSLNKLWYVVPRNADARPVQEPCLQKTCAVPIRACGVLFTV